MKYDNLDNAIKRFTLTYDDNKAINLNSYSLEFLIEDLEKVLFHVADYPWNDNKYVKRLNRLCYLYFLDMFIKERSNIKRKKLLQNIYNAISNDKIITKLKNKPEKNITELNRMLWYYSYVKSKIIINSKFIKTELKTFKKNILTNLSELLIGFQNIDDYCDNCSKKNTKCKGRAMINKDIVYNSSIYNLV